MTDDLLNRTRAALDGVTPGPWDASNPGEDSVVRCWWGFPVAYYVSSANRRFIAAARERVAELEGVAFEAKAQLEYLDERNPTGTTPAVLARIAAALRDKAKEAGDE